jgi:dTDP-4-amino-4,6-dideoxygalactose transaminase
MKTAISDLAIFGGKPAFGEILHVGRPNIGDRERLHARFDDMLDRRWLSNNGPLVQEFERAISDYVGVEHTICVCNATIGLEIAARAADLAGEVIVPSFTFVATAHALKWQEITPVFSDVDGLTHNLDPASVERHITPRTSAILATHLWGRPCAISELQEIADRHGLKLMFDAAHAFGCSYNGRMVGSFGLAEIFSFHATKFLNSFEGGAICTNDASLAKRIRLMTNFGFAGYDHVIHVGTNGKMTEVCAAMGLTSLEGIDGVIKINRENWIQYSRNLEGLSGVKLLEYDQRQRSNFQYIVLEIDPLQCGIERDWFIEILQSENVAARRYFYPGVHRMEPYRSYFPHSGLLLPKTEALAGKVLILPTGTAVGCSEIQSICEIIRLCVQNAKELGRALIGRTRKLTPDLR